jgi:hypothetical protein
MDLVADASESGLPIYVSLGAIIVGYIQLPSRVASGGLELALPSFSVPIIRSQVPGKPVCAKEFCTSHQ